MIKNILVDFDDTLIYNSYSYYLPQIDATRVITSALGRLSPGPREIMDLATEWQLNDIKIKGTITKTCFPESYLHTYRNLCAKSKLEPQPGIMGAIVEIASRYMLEEYEIIPGTTETLNKLALDNKNLVMFTKGSK